MFVEQDRARGKQLAGPMSGDMLSDLTAHEDPFRWLFLSDVCKHCENAGCLEACPTGSIIRTEVGSVLVQNDICNGCGYCVVGCPFGVIDRRKKPLKDAGGAFKCTFCYDRQASGMVPSACAKSCPTESILFGPLDEAADPRRKAACLQPGGAGQPVIPTRRTTTRRKPASAASTRFFCCSASPRPTVLPSKPQVPTIYLRAAWTSAFATAAAAVLAADGGLRVLLEAPHPLSILLCLKSTIPPSSNASKNSAAPAQAKRPRGRARRRRGRRADPRRPADPTNRTAASAPARITPARRATTGCLPSSRRCGRGRIPLYFFIGGAAGMAAVIAMATIVPGAHGHHPSGDVGRGGRWHPHPDAADHGPRAAPVVPEHAADLQAAVRHVDGRLHPDPVRRSR